MAFFSMFKNTVFLCLLILSSCGNQPRRAADIGQELPVPEHYDREEEIMTGASDLSAYLPLMKGKKITVVANQTSVIFKEQLSDTVDSRPFTHLIDSLLALEVQVVKVFAPEHGFRGQADAGELLADGRDSKTGLPIISLYGENRKPSKQHLEDTELLLFDIQDVGVRFYTYIATLQLVMEACAENRIPIVVLDRPNPNGHYVDGPTMEQEHTGFLGMSPIPLVYGMTIGEYAGMLNGEGWLKGGFKADLTVIPLRNYTHASYYSVPIRPSPNLPNDQAINLYPSLGLFEGTNVNAGRGTDFQFQRYGAPFLDSTAYTFRYTPASNFGAANPKHNGKLCYGKDLSGTPRMGSVSLYWIMDAYRKATAKKAFFLTSGFTSHAGTEILQKQIESGLSEEEIKQSWEPDLTAFKKIREKYLLYPLR